MNDAVYDYLESQISSGFLGPGDKLPTERAMTRQFGVSRNAVRSVLKKLEERGQITRLIGCGTFVTGRQPKIKSGNDFSESDASPSEVMEIRLMIEPPAAEALATRANRSDLDHMEVCLKQAEAASSWEGFEKWDAALHATMIRAARNQFLIDIFSRINDARRQGEWGKLKWASHTEKRRRAYQIEHRAFVEALNERDGPSARRLVENHLLHVRRNLLGY